MNLDPRFALSQELEAKQTLLDQLRARLIPKRSAGPRATKIGVVSLKALDHHRPNREDGMSKNRRAAAANTAAIIDNFRAGQ